MGSLTSRPKGATIPATQVVYVTQPTVTASATDTGADTSGSAAKAASENRISGLLARDRGRYGTVRTSLLGLLEPASNGGVAKKTLLGQ